jgi:hypothetical protein
VGFVESDAELRRKARERAEAKLAFYIHLVVYVGVNSLLFLIWLFTGGVEVFPWFIFPLVFWGIGLIAHYLTAFTHSDYVNRMADEEFRRLKEEQRQQS